MAPQKATTIWIKPTDFLRTTFSIQVKNLTTRTDSTAEGLGIEAEILETRQDGLTLRLNRKAAALGHHLMAMVMRQGGNSSFIFTFTGKITQIEPASGEAAEFTIQFLQFIKEDWRKFLDLCEENQKRVDAILKGVKE